MGILQADTLESLTNAFKRGVTKGVTGSIISPDNVFNNMDRIMEILENAIEGTAVTPLSSTHSFTASEPSEPLSGDETTVCHYRFDDATGTEAADISSNDNDLTVSGAVWATGKFSGCLEFDGTDDYASCTIVSSEPIRDYLYASAWINPDSDTGNMPIFMFDGAVLIYLDSGELKATLTFSGTPVTVSSGLSITPEEWNFVTFQFSGGDVFLCVGDMVYKETIAQTTWIDGEITALTVGSDTSNFYDGKIDELLVEANSVIADTLPLYTDTNSMKDIVFWPFSEHTGTIVNDTKILGTPLNITGATWVEGTAKFALDFDGTNDYGEAVTTAETLANQSLTVEVQCKFGTTGDCPILTQENGINLAVSSGSIVAALGGVSNPTSPLCSLSITVDEWYNIAVVYDGATKDIYINGHKYGSVAATGTAVVPAASLFVARNGSTYGDITIDRIRIYRGKLRPLTRSYRFFVPGQDGLELDEEWMVP